MSHLRRLGTVSWLKFLTTGLTPKDKKADPPMKAYTLSRAGAEAIAAYLNTLK